MRCGCTSDYTLLRIVSISANPYNPRMTPIVVRLRELREACGLSQLELSERAGVRQATISELESGKKQRLDFGILDRLCAALGVDPGELLEREKKRGRGK